MSAKDRHLQTQEKLQTNGDPNRPKDSKFRLIPQDQKVKRHSLKEKESVPAGLPGAALQTGAAAHPFCIAHPPQGDRGLEGTDFG